MIIEKPKVSVIVPVYNVQPYIRKCLESIVNQTYQNIEIILVDDGSSDQSGTICDEYALHDSRIKVIHQTSRGIAAARNAGLRVAAGEWIAWVDSDDWVSVGFVQYLLDNALKYDADIVICGRYEEHNDGRYFISPGQRMLDSQSGIKELLNDDVIKNYMWDKLWRAELFDGLSFRENIRIFEDAASSYYLFDRANKILCCPDGYYHYRIRNDGLSSSSHCYSLLYFQIKKERYEFVSQKYPLLCQDLEDNCLHAALTAWTSYYIQSHSERSLLQMQYSEVSSFIKDHYPGRTFLNHCSKAERLIVRLSVFDAKWARTLTGLISCIYRKQHVDSIKQYDGQTMGTDSGENSLSKGMLVQPAFSDCTDAIVFCVNDWFCPYLSVMLFSVIEHASASRKYDIVILHRDISPENQKILCGMGEGKRNISIRFQNVLTLIENYSLYVGGRQNFTVDIYLRFLIPDVLAPSYHKALYLDSDMLAFADVGELLDTQVDGYLLASSRDLSGLAEYYDPSGNRKMYRDSVLKLKSPDDYFISGMLVFNLDAFRAEYSSEKLLQLAASRDWMQHDQDVLNIICDGGRAKILHASWDVLKPYKPELLPPACRTELEEALISPKIIHFGGDEKPWMNMNSPWMDQFWDTAAKTPYYKEMVYRLLKKIEKTGKGKFEADTSQDPPFYRSTYFVLRKFYGGVRCLQENGLHYTVRRTFEHLTGKAK